MTFGYCLKRWREYRGLSLTDLAAAASVSALTLVLLEEAASPAGCGLVPVFRLAKALGVTVEQLMEGIGPREEPPHGPQP